MYTEELIKEEAVVHIFNLLAWLLPCAGLFGGGIFSILKRRGGYILWGMGIGIIGPLNLLLWKLYSFVLDSFGFDSVKAFFFNIFIFVAIGIILGFLFLFVLKLHKKEV